MRTPICKPKNSNGNIIDSKLIDSSGRCSLGKKTNMGTLICKP
jgi:hypothetical protein